MIQKIALIVSIILPLWNIPFILRIMKRKSSHDVSLSWAVGVWVCLVLIAPSGFTSRDTVWRTYNIANFISFSAVLVTVLLHRKKKE